MIPKKNNYAFIDSQNLNLGVQELGWKLDYKRFRVYLKDKYHVERAYMFMGFIPTNQNLYKKLFEAGYIICFKPTTQDLDGKVKGNVDADIVLRAILECNTYDKAIIVTNDGDFYSLVAYLYTKSKLEVVFSPNSKYCSKLLARSSREKLRFANDLRVRLEYKVKRLHLRTKP